MLSSPSESFTGTNLQALVCTYNYPFNTHIYCITHCVEGTVAGSEQVAHSSTDDTVKQVCVHEHRVLH